MPAWVQVISVGWRSEVATDGGTSHQIPEPSPISVCPAPWERRVALGDPREGDGGSLESVNQTSVSAPDLAVLDGARAVLPKGFVVFVEKPTGSLGKSADIGVGFTESAPDLAVLDGERRVLPQEFVVFVEKLTGSQGKSADFVKVPCDFVNWLADTHEERSENDSESAEKTFC